MVAVRKHLLTELEILGAGFLQRWRAYGAGTKIFLRQRAVLQATFIRAFFLAPVDDGRLVDRIAHRPVEQSGFLKVDVCLFVESPLISVRANVANQLLKQISINPFTNNIFVRPLRHCLRESPFCFPHETLKFTGKLFRVFIHDAISV